MTDPVTTEPALPPLGPEHVIAKPEYISRLTPDSYQPLPGWDGFETRTFGMEKATGGVCEMVSLRAAGFTGSSASPWHVHSVDQVEYILEGWAVCEFEGIGVHRFEKGDAFLEKANNRHRQLEVSDDFVSLQIAIPAVNDTTFYVYDTATETYNDMFLPHRPLPDDSE
jgi:hypothetical protein